MRQEESIESTGEGQEALTRSRRSTLNAWRMAVTSPNEATFPGLIEDQPATPGRAIAWLATSFAVPAPLTIMTAAIGMISAVSCPAIPIGICALVHNLLAIKSVLGCSWGAAAGTVFALLLILALLGGVIGTAI
jgi:hypothetical protein